MPTQITFAEFREQIKQSDKKIIENLNKALMILALKGEAQAKKNATTFPRVRTGRLRSSITGLVDAKNGNPRAVLRAGGDTSGSPVFYARFMEFGAPARNLVPRYFMGRAIQKITRDDVPKQLENLLALSLDQK
tara:strand:+ start:31 stop:432 length:402 start_codon:yes stop_codon:yes gene_type:complete